LTQHLTVYQHAKRPEWGYCAVIETHEDRTTFKFDDGLSRTIRHDHLQMMQRVNLEEPQASEVQKRLAKHTTARALRVDGKPKAKRAPAKKAAAAAAATVPIEATAGEAPVAASKTAKK
jgi:hypothetical protein